MKTLVAGAGGFIGGYLTKRLLEAGKEVRAVDIKPLGEWFQRHDCENRVLDLRRLDPCHYSVSGVDEVYNLACNMGGMGFIENHRAECMLSVLINTHLLMASRDAAVERYFYASSACVYPGFKQDTPNVVALAEGDAYPADPEDGYGWEKLFGERMCRHFTEDFGFKTTVARLHNVYGPHGTWEGGREKAPAAICRKVALAKKHGLDSIEIWGDGNQTRSFMWIEDALAGIRKIAGSDSSNPINLGSSELVTIDQLVDLAEEIADIKLARLYRPDMPQGVRGRNSDNALIYNSFGWVPSTPLRAGLEQTYSWIEEQVGGA